MDEDGGARGWAGGEVGRSGSWGRADESVGKQPEVMAGEAGLWWWRTAGSTAGGGGRRHCWWRRPAALLVEEPLGQRGSTSNF